VNGSALQGLAGQLYIEDLKPNGEQTVPDGWFSIVAQFSAGEPMLFAEDQDHIKPEEFSAVMRTLARKATFK
jgi:hypothetical protein